jgi:3-methyladenine DNA glycosylase AlkD
MTRVEVGCGCVGRKYGASRPRSGTGSPCSGDSKAGKLVTKTLRLTDLKRQLAAAADPVRAEFLSRYFRAEKGGYGEGDQFLGITVPALRAITRRFTHLPLQQIGKLLASPIHEERLAALMVLVAQYSEADARARRQIFDFYLKCTRSIDNWDLVDASAREIVGIHLLDRSRRPLRRLAKSENVWERRIAIVATHAFLRAGEVEETFAIARLLLGDNHDLIHKAVGWMLREAGKQSMPELLQFLEKNYTLLPRTTLRYAIERLPTIRRKRILLGRFD